MEELSDEDKLVVARARRLQKFLTQPFTVAEVFVRIPGKYVKLTETIAVVKKIISGQFDDTPEEDFYMKGGNPEGSSK